MAANVDGARARAEFPDVYANHLDSTNVKPLYDTNRRCPRGPRASDETSHQLRKIMSDEEAEGHPEPNGLIGELLDLGQAASPLLRRLPNAAKAIDKLTGGLVGAGTQALASRLHRYRTGNLVKEAQLVADASGLPLPTVLATLARQRRIDELTIDAVRRVAEKGDAADVGGVADVGKASSRNSSDRWFETLREQAGIVDEPDVSEAFVRVLAGEIETPGSFSVRTLRSLGAMSRSTAQRFRRAASVSVRLTPDRKHIMDARIPAVGGALGSNCLQAEGLSYSVLTDLTENGLLHPDYNSYQPYGPLDLPGPVRQQLGPLTQIPFAHQDAMWTLVPKAGIEKAASCRVVGAQLTSCGVELLRIVDIEPLPNFTTKLVEYFSQLGYHMVRSQ